MNVWGAFCATGKSELVILDENVTGAVYRQILDQNLVPWARGIFGSNFRYQDDNAPAHRTRVVQMYIENNHINNLWHPPLSPDLNPSEHPWDELWRSV